MQYKGYNVGDMIYYRDDDYEDRAIGIIDAIIHKDKEIVITWIWSCTKHGEGLDELEFDDFDSLNENNCMKIITEKEKLEIILRS